MSNSKKFRPDYLPNERINLGNDDLFIYRKAFFNNLNPDIFTPKSVTYNWNRECISEFKPDISLFGISRNYDIHTDLNLNTNIETDFLSNSIELLNNKKVDLEEIKNDEKMMSVRSSVLDILKNAFEENKQVKPSMLNSSLYFRKSKYITTVHNLEKFANTNNKEVEQNGNIPLKEKEPLNVDDLFKVQDKEVEKLKKDEKSYKLLPLIELLPFKNCLMNNVLDKDELNNSGNLNSCLLSWNEDEVDFLKTKKIINNQKFIKNFTLYKKNISEANNKDEVFLNFKNDLTSHENNEFESSSSLLLFKSKTADFCYYLPVNQLLLFKKTVDIYFNHFKDMEEAELDELKKQRKDANVIITLNDKDNDSKLVNSVYENLGFLGRKTKLSKNVEKLDKEETTSKTLNENSGKKLTKNGEVVNLVKEDDDFDDLFE